MKFSISKKSFGHYVQYLTQIVPQKSTMQITSSILLECNADTNKVTIVTTDLNITAIVTVNANVIESGSICIPSKNFSDIIQALPDSMIQFEIVNDKLKVICEKSNFNLNFIDSSLFPIVPEYESGTKISFDRKVFATLVNNTSFATGVDAANPMYSGIYCNISSTEQIMAATDSKRIAEAKYISEMDIEEPIEFVIPVKSLIFLEKFFANDDSEITMIDDATKVVLQYKNVVIISNKYAGKYPIYTVVFKKEHEHTLMLDKTLLRDATRRVALLNTDEERSIVKLSINKDEVTLEAISSEFGAGREVIDSFI